MAEPYRGILGPVLGQVEAIKSARSNRAMDELQAKYLQQGFDVRQQEAQQKTQAEQARSEIEYAANIFGAVAQSDDPETASQRLMVGNPKFLEITQRHQLGDFSDPSGMTPDQKRSVALDNWRALGGVLQQQQRPAGIETFDFMTKTAQEKGPRGQAARINLGLEGRAEPIGQPSQPMSPEQLAQWNLPPGTSAFIDPATQQPKIVQKADTQAGADQEQGQRRLEQQIIDVDTVLGNVSEAVKGINWNTVGFIGARLKNVEGTDAFALREALEPIKASLGFDRLQLMRDMSKTGGALGNVAVQELNALQKSVTSLEQGQTGAQLKSNLMEVAQRYNNWKAAMIKALMAGERPGGEGGGAPAPAAGGGGPASIDPLGIR